MNPTKKIDLEANIKSKITTEVPVSKSVKLNPHIRVQTAEGKKRTMHKERALLKKTAQK